MEDRTEYVCLGNNTDNDNDDNRFRVVQEGSVDEERNDNDDEEEEVLNVSSLLSFASKW